MRRCLLIVSLFSFLCQGQVVKGVKQLPDRLNVTLSDGTLCISPLNENAVRIQFYKGVKENFPELVFNSIPATPQFQVSDSPSKLVIKHI